MANRTTVTGRKIFTKSTQTLAPLPIWCYYRVRYTQEEWYVKEVR